MSILRAKAMIDVLNRLFFAGFIRLHVLYHADKEPICGVKIMEELKRHGYDLSPGTLYPILRQLHEAGRLPCKEEGVAGKRRKNFRITASGKRGPAQAPAKPREPVSEGAAAQDPPTN